MFCNVNSGIFSFLKFDEIKLGFQNGRSLIIRRETNEENVSEEISEAINTQEKIIIELYVADKDAPIESLVLGTTYGARLMSKVWFKIYIFWLNILRCGSGGNFRKGI